MSKDIYDIIDDYEKGVKRLDVLEQLRLDALSGMEQLYSTQGIMALKYIAENVPSDIIFNLNYFFTDGTTYQYYLTHSANKKLKEEELLKLKEIILDNLEEYMDSSDFYLLVLDRIKERKPNATGEEIITYLNQALYMMNKNKRNEEAEVNRLVRLKNNK